MTISDSLWEEVVATAPRNADGYLRLSFARFDETTFEGAAGLGGATFEGNAWFGGATFEGNAWFAGATFEGSAGFDQATFKGNAAFGGVTFQGDAAFNRATFQGDAAFGGATFQGDASFNRATFQGDASFNRATFQGDAAFGGAIFEGGAWFGGANFKGNARFGGATLEGNARFRGAIFDGDVAFNRATFKGSAVFNQATFKGEAGFDRATFEGAARFGEAILEGSAGFDRATFKRNAWFSGAAFEGNAGFDRATFERDARFDRATFQGDAGFSGAAFEGNVPVLGPIAVRGELNLDGVHFASAVRIEIDASALSCRRGRFPGGVQLDVQGALVRLDDTDLSVPSLLTGPPANDPAGKQGQPRLLSLQGTNAAALTLGNVDLADCRFAGAHNLDKLRLEADATFGLSPAVAGWERRQVIAEEAAWRSARARPGRWTDPLWRGPDDPPEPPSPGAIAGLYRALRKGREDAKDEPGAADFYYGEMEMRRHDRGSGGAHRWRGRASRIVLTAYWLFSGYGLRAWRSLASLAIVMAVFAAAFRLVGFIQPAPYWKSLLFAFRSTISLTDAQVKLTAWGGLFQALLRLTGPVLLALTLLALRGRVKR